MDYTVLRHFVCMLINGQDLTTHESQASLSISQLIHFNTKGNHCETSKMRHNKDQEPPLPIYLGLQVRTSTRNKSLINSLYILGLSVNYKSVLELEDQLACAVSEKKRDSILSEFAKVSIHSRSPRQS